MNPILYRHIVYPLYRLVKGDGIISNLQDIRRIKKLSSEELRQLQTEKLDRLLRHAYENVPYYRDLFQRIGLDPKNLLADFHQIPPLEKKHIRQNLGRLKSVKQERGNKLLPNSTSGSTGEKLIFYYDQRSNTRRKAIVAYDEELLGIRLGDRISRLWGAPMDLNMAASFRGRLHARITNQLTLSTYQLSDESLDRYFNILCHFRPVLLVSYPSPLATFCEYLRKNQLRFSSLNAVITSAEQLFPWQRELIEETLGAPVYNRYGSREFGDIAHELPCHQGLHVHNNRILLEILDRDMRPIPQGQTGEIYITDLDNFGMPFIRYRIGDRSRWATTQKCSCGIQTPLLAAVEGRSFDVVKAPNGNRVGGTFWTILFRQRPGILHFQVHQINLDQLVIRYVLDEDTNVLPKTSLRYWETQIKEACGERMAIDFIHVDKIKQTVSGKMKIVITDLPDQ